MNNNCFIESIIQALLSYKSFVNIINNNDNKLLQAIKYFDIRKINNIVFSERTESTQEDAQEFLTNKLLPYFKKFNIHSKEITLNNYELDFINEFSRYNKSKLIELIKKYKFFNGNYKFFSLIYDFFDNNDHIYTKNYNKVLNLDDLFTVFYINNLSNEIYKSYNIILYNNLNFSQQLQNIYILNYNPFLIINISYINDINPNNRNNFIIPKQFNCNAQDKYYCLKSIIYYVSFDITNMFGSLYGHYYCENVNENHNYNYYIYNNDDNKAVLLFYELTYK